MCFRIENSQAIQARKVDLRNNALKGVALRVSAIFATVVSYTLFPVPTSIALISCLSLSVGRRIVELFKS